MIRTTLTTVLVLLTFTAMTYANPEPAKSAVSSEVVELNLINGLESGNTGLQISSANYLGETSSNNAVIPLLKLFNSSNDDGVRIAAALALVKIGDGRGVKAVEYAAQYDESPKVKQMCKKFYNSYKMDKVK